MSQCPVERMYVGNTLVGLLEEQGIRCTKKIENAINEVLDEIHEYSHDMSIIKDRYFKRVREKLNI